MLYIVMAYLWVSLLLYILMGGADFGAGILEFFSARRNKNKTKHILYQAIGAIWEANHMWLIIAISILFVGFPVIYSTISIYLHIPLTIMLLGIIARGTAFTFRNDDATPNKMQSAYSRIYRYSCIITPLFIGIIAGSVVSGKIDTDAHTFLNAYIFGWLNFFSVSVGIFTTIVCGFLASIFIIGKTKTEEERKRFIAKSKQMSIATLGATVLVFIASMVDDVPLSHWLFGNPVSFACVVIAFISLVWMWLFLFANKTEWLRLVVGAQITLLLIAITYEHYPVIVNLKNGTGLSLIAHNANEKTIKALAISLLAGSVLILPALYYLLYSFGKKEKNG